jgi:hypothetical protein
LFSSKQQVTRLTLENQRLQNRIDKETCAANEDRAAFEQLREEFKIIAVAVEGKQNSY